MQIKSARDCGSAMNTGPPNARANAYVFAIHGATQLTTSIVRIHFVTSPIFTRTAAGRRARASGSWGSGPPAPCPPCAPAAPPGSRCTTHGLWAGHGWGCAGFLSAQSELTALRICGLRRVFVPFFLSFYLEFISHYYCLIYYSLHFTGH